MKTNYEKQTELEELIVVSCETEGDEAESGRDAIDTDSDVVEVMRLEQMGRPTRSFIAIDSELQVLCFVVQAYVTEYAYFRNPLLSVLDVVYLVN